MKGKSRWILVAIVAALVAMATTAIILALRARAKKRALLECDDAEFDCDVCQSFEFDENGDLIEDAPVAEDVVAE